MLSSIMNLRNWLIQLIVRAVKTQEYLTLQIDITNACNLNCSHCYHHDHKNSEAIKLNDWVNILCQYDDLLKTLSLAPSLVICGGEPLLSPYFKPLVLKIKEKWPNAPMTVLTNGTLLQDKISFIKLNDIDVQVSLDGASKEFHDSVRGYGSFKKSSTNISKAVDAGIRVHILTILSKRTSSMIEVFFELGKKLGVNSVNFTRLIPEGHGAKLIASQADGMLYKYDLKKALESIVYMSKKYGVVTNTKKPLYCLIDDSLGANSKFGFQGVVIDYKGNLKVSSRANYIAGNVLRDGGLKKLFLKHPIFVNLRQGQIEGCRDCKYYRKCGGDRNISFSATGSFFKKDIGCWLQTT